jgi:hypothetical protein
MGSYCRVRMIIAISISFNGKLLQGEDDNRLIESDP